MDFVLPEPCVIPPYQDPVAAEKKKVRLRRNRVSAQEHRARVKEYIRCLEQDLMEARARIALLERG
jgi:hypothetical protein